MAESDGCDSDDGDDGVEAVAGIERKEASLPDYSECSRTKTQATTLSVAYQAKHDLPCAANENATASIPEHLVTASRIKAKVQNGIFEGQRAQMLTN